MFLTIAAVLSLAFGFSAVNAAPASAHCVNQPQPNAPYYSGGYMVGTTNDWCQAPQGYEWQLKNTCLRLNYSNQGCSSFGGSYVARTCFSGAWDTYLIVHNNYYGYDMYVYSGVTNVWC